MLQICQINISGLSNRSCIALDKYNHSIGNDVIAVQETLVDPKDDRKVSPEFTNMNSFYLKNDRGVSLSIKPRLLPQRLSDLEDSTVDAIWVTLSINSRVILLGNFYVNPNSPSNNLKAAFVNINNALLYATKFKLKDIIILGDFNSRHEKWADSTTNKLGKLLDEFMANKNLAGLSPNAYTFRNLNGGSVIDLTFVSATISKQYHSSSVDGEVELFSGAPIRGHLPVIHQFNISQNNIHQSRKLSIYKDMKNTDWRHWQAELSLLLDDLNIDEQTDAEILWKDIKYAITETNEKVMPTKTISEHSKPFWTSELSTLSLIARHAKAKMCKKSTPSNIALYEETKNKFSDELIKTKNCWIRDKLEHLNVSDSKTFWKNYRRSIVGDKRESLGNLVDNNVIHTSVEEKEIILFNTFFTGAHMKNASFDTKLEDDINDKLQQYFPKDSQPSVASQNVSSNATDPLNCEVTLTETYEAIKRQNCSVKSFDSDNFHPYMLKNLPPNAVMGLCKLFNLSFASGNWLWDTSNVVFMKKEGKSNYLKAGAYRPISISSYIGKLFERVIESRIKSHCDFEGILDDEQEGFRCCRNTTRYLYKMIASLKEAQKRKFTAFLLCLDFEKAFDSVWHKGLIFKLYGWNIRGQLLQLIRSFLFTRKVKLIINGTSCPVRLCGEYGVPQGSVLSPLLFILYVSDMFNLSNSTTTALCKEHCSYFKYADDGSIIILHKDPSICNQLAQELCDHLATWCTQWRLTVNCDENKTECLVIRPHGKCDTRLKQLDINGNKIKFAKSTKILGLVVDDLLSFKIHAGKTLQRCWYSWYKITRNSHRHYGLNISSLVILFKSVVLSKLLYAAPVWLNSENQKKFKKFYARVCLKISGSTHYSPQAITLLAIGLEPIKLMYNLVCTKFVLKALTSDDTMKGIICQIEGSRDHPFYKHINMTKDYVLTKFNHLNGSRINHSNSSIINLDESYFIYTNADIDAFKLKLWNDFLAVDADSKSLLIMNPESNTDQNSYPTQSFLQHKILFPRSSKRSTDTKIMSLLHGHDLAFGSFRQSTGLTSDPSCYICPGEKDSNKHQLINCPRFNCRYRDSLQGISDSDHLAQGVLSQLDTSMLQGFRKMAQIILRN